MDKGIRRKLLIPHLRNKVTPFESNVEKFFLENPQPVTILTEQECKLDLWPGFCTTIRSSIKVSILVRAVSIHSSWRNQTQRWMFWSGSHSVLFRIYHGMIRPGAEFTQPRKQKDIFDVSLNIFTHALAYLQRHRTFPFRFFTRFARRCSLH